MEIVLIGNTGSGKTTLAEEIARRTGLPHLSSGDFARRLAEEDADTRVRLNSGMMAPEEAMRNLVKQAVEEASIKHGGYILEGFPRTMAQLVAILTWSKSLPTFIELLTPQVVCVQRLLERGRDGDGPDTIANRFKFYQSETQPVIDALEQVGMLQVIHGNYPIHDVFAQLERCGIR